MAAATAPRVISKLLMLSLFAAPRRSAESQVPFPGTDDLAVRRRSGLKRPVLWPWVERLTVR